MSERYECDRAPDVVLVAGGAQVGDTTVATGEYALIIGDPSAAAFVVFGSPESLQRFARTVSDLTDPL